MKVKKTVLSIKPYEAGKPISEVEREYGIKNAVKLASNENPLGFSPKVEGTIKNAVKYLNRYPENRGLREKLAEKYEVSPKNIILGNGSDEILKMFADTLLTPETEAIMTKPSFLVYDIAVKSAGATSVFIPLTDNLDTDFDVIKSKITSKTRIIFLTNPNNPTGYVIKEREFDRFIADIPEDILVIIDEAYVEFARDKEMIKSLMYMKEGANIAVTRTFSKAYGLAGLRIGYSVMPEELALMMNRVRLPFNVNSVAAVAAAAALEDERFLNESLDITHKGIDFLCKELDKMKVAFFPTQANFILIDIKRDADAFFKAMLKDGIIIRSMSSYGYPNYIRVSVGLPEENEKFLNIFEKSI